MNQELKCVTVFRRTYFKEPEDVAFCPYRICPLGAHVDHQHGRITGLAIDKGIHFAYHPKRNGVVELSSVQFERRAQWHIHQIDEKPVGDWADYLRGATWALSRRFRLHTGICGVISGSLPIGGLSSSAALILVFLSALSRVNGIEMTDAELVGVALEAERDYVGVSVGKLDQSCEVYSRRDHLLYLDTLDDQYELIPVSPAMKPFDIAIIFSGLERSLAGSQYNMRVDEMKAAAYALMGHAGIPYGKFSEARLRQVPRAVYDRYQHLLPDAWRRRAAHYYGEAERVQQGVDAWRRGDLERFGQLVFESGRSSICNYETGSEELCALYDIMRHTDGVYGGRFSGAGFKGCCIALLDPAYSEQAAQRIGSEYLRQFPALEGRYSFHLCRSADGIGSGRDEGQNGHHG